MRERERDKSHQDTILLFSVFLCHQRKGKKKKEERRDIGRRRRTLLLPTPKF